MASTKNDYRKITKLGQHSYYVTLPPDMLKELGWKERRKVKVTKRGKKIIIEDWEG